MDMDKRIHLELRNRTPSDVSICQKYLCRSILLLCVYVYVRCGEALFFEGGRLGGVDLGVGLQMNCKVGGLKCHPSMFRLLPPPLPLVCVTTCACAPACASVGARVWVRECACECAPIGGQRAHAFGSERMRQNHPLSSLLP